jgi:hypothetical protein
MQGLMMDYPLTLTHLLERSAKLFPKNRRARLNRTPAGPETLGICTLVVSGGMAVHFFGVL